MLNIKSKKKLPFLCKKMKKGGNFDHGCKKNRALLGFCNLVSRFCLIVTKMLFSIEFSAHNLWKSDFFF